jgi:hypothetical protein
VSLTIFLDGVGLIGPGLPGWAASAAVLAAPQRHAPAEAQIPPPQGLPSAERRRVGTPIKLALAVGLEAANHAGREPATLPSVFSSSAGDGDNCHAICETLAGPDRLLSPTRFHNSVHNAAAGYWSIATRSMAASTSLCAHDGSFAAGLLETALQVRAGAAAALLVCADVPYPEPLHSVRPLVGPLGLALVLTAEAGPRTLARLTLELDGTVAAATPLPAGSLEALRQGNPSGRGLALLHALARQQARQVVLPYLSGCSLRVAIQPENAP